MKQENKSTVFHGWTIVDEGSSFAAYNDKGERKISSVESVDVCINLIINVFGG